MSERRSLAARERAAARKVDAARRRLVDARERFELAKAEQTIVRHRLLAGPGHVFTKDPDPVDVARNWLPLGRGWPDCRLFGVIGDRVGGVGCLAPTRRGSSRGRVRPATSPPTNIRVIRACRSARAGSWWRTAVRRDGV